MKQGVAFVTQIEDLNYLLMTQTLMIHLNQSFVVLYQKSLERYQRSLEKGLSWIIDSVIAHTINVLKCKTLLFKNLNLARKSLINIQHIDHNEDLK